MTEPIKVTLDSSLEIEGREDTPQLIVKGASAQTEPLQVWQSAVGEVLAELTSDGELRVGGEVVGETPAALVEANAQMDIDSSKPKRGWQSRGEIIGEIADVIRWAVHELVLRGEDTLSGLHAALRAEVAVEDNTDPALDAQNVEVHAAEFEAINRTGTETEPVGRLVAVQAALTNEEDAYLSEAVGFEVSQPVNQGEVARLVGVQINDLGASEEGAERYAIWTGSGQVRLGDVLELVEPDPVDPELAKSVQVYVKDDGALYARDGAEVEYNLLADVGAETLDDLTDVGITSAAEGDILRRNATTFVNVPLGDFVFLESEHLVTSSGAADAGKPIKLDAGGHVDASLINEADIDHGSLDGLADDDHPQYHNDTRGDARYLQKAIFDANTLVKADADNTPTALSVPEQTLLGRITSGVIAALTGSQVWGILATLTQDLLPDTDLTRSLGSAALRWLHIFAISYLGDSFGQRVKNTSGSTISAGAVGYINSSGEFKLIDAVAAEGIEWCVALTGGANNADMYVATRGQVLISVTGSVSAGDFLITSDSGSGGLAQAQTYMSPAVFARALTADSGGSVEALLLTQHREIPILASSDFFGVTSASDLEFTGTISAISGSVVTYTPSTGAEDNLKPSATGHLAKMLVHNISPSNKGSALIANNEPSTNQLTLTASVPGSWAVGDTITIKSQTNTTTVNTNSYFADLQLLDSGVVPDLAFAVKLAFHNVLDTGAAGQTAFIHPFEAGNVTAKRIRAVTQAANIGVATGEHLISLLNRRIQVTWDASSSSTLSLTLRLHSILVKAP